LPDKSKIHKKHESEHQPTSEGGEAVKGKSQPGQGPQQKAPGFGTFARGAFSQFLLENVRERAKDNEYAPTSKILPFREKLSRVLSQKPLARDEEDGEGQARSDSEDEEPEKPLEEEADMSRYFDGLTEKQMDKIVYKMFMKEQQSMADNESEFEDSELEDAADKKGDSSDIDDDDDDESDEDEEEEHIKGSKRSDKQPSEANASLTRGAMDDELLQAEKPDVVAYDSEEEAEYSFDGDVLSLIEDFAKANDLAVDDVLEMVRQTDPADFSKGELQALLAEEKKRLEEYLKTTPDEAIEPDFFLMLEEDRIKKEEWRPYIMDAFNRICYDLEELRTSGYTGGVWDVAPLLESPYADTVFMYSRPSTQGRHPATWPRSMLDLLESEKMPQVDMTDLELAPEERKLMELAWSQIIKNPSISEKARRSMLQRMARRLGVDRANREQLYNELVLGKITAKVDDTIHPEADWADDDWDIDAEDDKKPNNSEKQHNKP